MEFRRVLFRSRPKTPPHGPCSKAMPAVEASALEKHRNSSVSATSAALMKRNGRSASAFPQPLQRHETDDIKEEPTMIVHPEPSAIIPDRRIYARRESGVRSNARSLPRQFVR